MIVTAVQAEGARVGIVTCPTCGAAVLLHPRDDPPSDELHAAWHKRQGVAASPDGPGATG